MGDPTVSFVQAVSRHLVHRFSIGEVFITDIVPNGPDAFVAGIQWPRRHALFSAPVTRLDSHLVAETIRQLTIFLCHSRYAVPMDARFLMPGLGFTIEPGAEAEFSNAAPANCTVMLKGEDLARRRSGELRSIRVQTEFSRNGRIIARGHGDAVIAAEGVYRRLRGDALEQVSSAWLRQEATVLSPRLVGHMYASDVVLSTGSGPRSWLLSVDTANPVYFDHPLDHIPGILAVETMRQAIRSAAGLPDAELGSFEATFVHVLEFDSPAEVRLTEIGDFFHMELIQLGRTAVRAAAHVRRANVSGRGRPGPVTSQWNPGRSKPQLPAGGSPTFLELAASGLPAL